MKSKLLWVGGTLLSVVVLAVYLYFAVFVKGDDINRLERQAFVARGDNKFEVTVLNGNGVNKVYLADSKVTSEPDKNYYFFWAKINGSRKYVQVPMDITVLEEK